MELQDARRNFELIHAIQGAKFHNNNLSAQMAYHRFNNLDKDYATRTTSCRECESFEERLVELEEDFMQEALNIEKHRRAAAGTRYVPQNYFRTNKKSIYTEMGQSMLNMQINDEPKSAENQPNIQMGDEQKRAEIQLQQQTASMIVAEEYWTGDDSSSMSSCCVIPDLEPELRSHHNNNSHKAGQFILIFGILAIFFIFFFDFICWAYDLILILTRTFYTPL